MGIFQSLGQQTPQTRQMPRPQTDSMQAMRQELGQIKSQPVSYLKGRGFDVPDGMVDAKEITQHLLRTGQVGASRLQQVMQMLGGIPHR